MGLNHVTVVLRSMSAQNGEYEADFLVGTGATDSLVPASELRKMGIAPVGRTAYELANGRVEEYSSGLVEISFMGEVTAGRVIFGPDEAEPILALTALESAGIHFNTVTRLLEKLPAMSLKVNKKSIAR